MTLSAFVGGPPAAMGSKIALISKKGSPILLNSNPSNLRTWQDAMRLAMLADSPPSPLSSPLSVSIIVSLKRPLSHFRSGRFNHLLKPSAPIFPTSKPDLDKIARATLDCGTNIWYKDDSQIAQLSISKIYADSHPHNLPGVLVTLSTL